MRRTDNWWTRGVAVAVSLAIATQWHVASAQSRKAKQQATVHFERGVELYRDRDYGAALVEFRRAEELAPHPQLVYNIAVTLSRLHRYKEASDEYRRYLRAAKRTLAADRRALVQREIARLRQRLATLTVEVNIAGAEILIDGQRVATSPTTEQFVVDMGKRQIRVEADGYIPEQTEVEFAAQGSRTLRVQLREQPPDSLPLIADLRTEIEASNEATARTTGRWVAAGFTLALAAGAGTSAYLAWDANQKLDDELDEQLPSRAEVERRRDRVRTFALATDGLVGAAVVAGAISLLLWTRSDDAVDPTGKDGVSATVGAYPGGLVVRGQF